MFTVCLALETDPAASGRTNGLHRLARLHLARVEGRVYINKPKACVRQCPKKLQIVTLDDKIISVRGPMQAQSHASKILSAR